jgi:hypothetical protein
MDSEFFRTFEQNEKDECTKICAYAGRYMFAFGQIESRVDKLIARLFNFDRFTWTVLITLLDMRKKIQLIDLARKHRGASEKMPLSSLNRLHDIRNMLAHSRFVPDYGNASHANGAGIEFDYVSLQSKSNIPNFASEGSGFAAFIPYAQFDAYDKEMSELYHTLEELSENVKPITEIGDAMERDIGAIIEQSANVLRFPARP